MKNMDEAMNGGALPERPNVALLMRSIEKALGAYRYHFGSEVQLHEAMAAALTAERIAFERERVAGPRDRFDFWISPGVVIEAKVKGSFSQAMHQCLRYAERPDVHGVILAASRHWAAKERGPTAAVFRAGVQIKVVHLKGAL